MLIEFKDIRKGDHIVATFVDGDLIRTYNGVAAEFTEYGEWLTTDGFLLIREDSKPECIFLADRTEPALPTEPGSLIMDVDTAVGAYPLMTLEQEGNWRVLPAIGGLATLWVTPDEIKSFRLAKVVPADD